MSVGCAGGRAGGRDTGATACAGEEQGEHRLVETPTRRSARRIARARAPVPLPPRQLLPARRSKAPTRRSRGVGAAYTGMLSRVCPSCHPHFTRQACAYPPLSQPPRTPTALLAFNSNHRINYPDNPAEVLAGAAITVISCHLCVFLFLQLLAIKSL